MMGQGPRYATATELEERRDLTIAEPMVPYHRCHRKPYIKPGDLF